MRRPALLLLAATQFLAACAMTFDGSRAGVPVTLASSVEAPPQGEPFAVESKAVYGLWGIATLRQPSLERTLRSQLVGAKEVRDVRITVKSKFSDVLVTVLTLGLIVPRTVQASGIIPAAPAAAAPAPAAAPPAGAAPSLLQRPAPAGQVPAQR
jgi:hypothetical protein